MSRRLSEDLGPVTLLETADIGGTTASTSWVSMAGFERFLAYVELGTFNAADDLDHCRIEQAKDSSGTDSKELTTDASGGDYDTDSPVDADGGWVVLEGRVEDLDVTGSFTHIRLVVGEDGDSGVDRVTAVLLRHGARHKHAQRPGAAVAGSKVYVTPN